MKMDNEQLLNIKFVLEVEKHPCLYNYTLPEYVRRDIADEAWMEIGRKFSLSGPECKEKWRNIRNVFVRNLKSNMPKKKPYYLNDVMQFMIPFLRLTNPAVSSSQSKPVFNTIIYKIENSDEEDIISTHDQLVTATPYENSTSETYNCHSLSPQSHTVPNVSTSPESSNGYFSSQLTPELQRLSRLPELIISHTDQLTSFSKKKCSTTQTSGDNVLSEEFKAEQARIERNQNLEQQPKKMFLLSLLPDVENMSDRQMRVFKARVTNIIETILENGAS